VVAAKAVCFREAMKPAFADYARRVVANAKALASSLAEAGWRIVSGGTDTHLMLVDLFCRGVRGKEAEKALDQAWITVNKNAIPFDENPPLNPSGIRLGSPAVTTRGFGEEDMREVASCIAAVLDRIGGEEAALEKEIEDVRRRVAALTEKYPLYSWKFSATGA
jgi:glycine hydroxymethyltransferase